MPRLCLEIDRAIGALLTDLKQRGLLDDDARRLGRRVRPHADATKRGTGRSCSAATTTRGRSRCGWPAAGVKPGVTVGRTDDFGYNIVEDPVHVHDLHATMLHLMGIDHEKLTYKFQGRDFRLTDVSGKVVQKLLA